MEDENTQDSEMTPGEEALLGMIEEVRDSVIDLQESVSDIEDKIDEVGDIKIPTKAEIAAGIKIPDPIPGKSPTEADLRNLIRPLIPEPKKHTDAEIVALIKPLIPEVKDGTSVSLKDVVGAIMPSIIARIPQGGGNMNRQINVNSSVMSQKYTDINFKAGSNVTLAKADDDTNKRVNITITSTGGGASVAGAAGSDTQVQFNDTGNLAATDGFTYNQNSSVVTASILAISSEKVTMPSGTATRGIDITNAANVAGIRITATSSIAASRSVGGNLLVTNGTTNTGNAAVFYSNVASALGRIVHITADNVSFNQEALYVESDSTVTTALGVTGATKVQGIIKVTHQGAADGSDANGSGISIDIADVGTAAQGLFINATSSTTGKLMNVRNSNEEKFVLGPTGATSILGNVVVGRTGSVFGAVDLLGTTSGYTRVQPASAAGSWSLTLPTGSGTAGQYLLTDGAGITQWASAVGVVTPTTTIWIDGNRTDTYTATGGIDKPYKTISAALSGFVVGSYTGVTFHISPFAYTEASNVVFPAISTTIHGNNSSLTVNGGAGSVTFPSAFDIYSLNLVANVLQTDTSVTTLHNMVDGSLVGNYTISGFATLQNMNTASGTITISANAKLGTGSTSLTTRIVNSGTLYLNNTSLIITDNSNYAVDSSAAGSLVFMSAANVQNLGTGGGVRCDNGATTTPNEITAVDIIVGNGTVGAGNQAILTGTSLTTLALYNAVTVGGTTLYASGSVQIAGVQAAVDITGTLKDANHSAGSAGQYLLSTGTGTQWASVTASGGSGITRTTSIITANTAAGSSASTDYVYVVAAGLALTLPSAGSSTNVYTVKNTSGSSVLVTAVGGKTMDGSGSVLVAINNQTLGFTSDGTNYVIV